MQATHPIQHKRDKKSCHSLISQRHILENVIQIEIAWLKLNGEFTTNFGHSYQDLNIGCAFGELFIIQLCIDQFLVQDQ